MHPVLNIVPHAAPNAEPEQVQQREPIKDCWYHGQSPRGMGAMAYYDGYGSFRLGDETEVDMTIYPYIVEHAPPKSS